MGMNSRLRYMRERFLMIWYALEDMSVAIGKAPWQSESDCRRSERELEMDDGVRTQAVGSR